MSGPWTRTTPKGRVVTFHDVAPTQVSLELVDADIDAMDDGWVPPDPDDPPDDDHAAERRALAQADRWAP